MQFLAAKSLWTNFREAKYDIPSDISIAICNILDREGKRAFGLSFNIEYDKIW